MAAADMTATEWGYVIGGTDTDARTVSSTKLVVKAMSFAGNTDNATCTLTSDVGGTATSCFKFKTNGWDLDCASSFISFGDKGIPLTRLIATLSHANDRLYIYLR